MASSLKEEAFGLGPRTGRGRECHPCVTRSPFLIPALLQAFWLSRVQMCWQPRSFAKPFGLPGGSQVAASLLFLATAPSSESAIHPCLPSSVSAFPN